MLLTDSILFYVFSSNTNRIGLLTQNEMQAQESKLTNLDLIRVASRDVHFRISNPTEPVPIFNRFHFRIRFICEEKLRVINLFRRCA